MNNWDMLFMVREQLNEISSGSDTKIAIYPYGQLGARAKEMLNKFSGIQEILIVDNGKADSDDNIKRISEIQNREDYIWIIATTNSSLYDELIVDLVKVPNIKIIDFMPREKYADEKYKVLSKIGKAGYFSVPCHEFLYLIEEKKKEGAVCVAEIGVANGATSVRACKKLDAKDTYYAFDFYDVVDPLIEDLGNVDEITCKLIGKGNSRKLFDSYNWHLSDMLAEMREQKLDGFFDVVYQDGGHDFVNCGLSCCLLKDMIKVGGYIIFDDFMWSMAKSSTCNPRVMPSVLERFTEAQIEECQIQRAVKTFMDYDERFEKVELLDSNYKSRVVYRRIR